ncbi:dienelactone hydrolase family protein [Talaromyces stipitatus ATCC 10500]|uniref:Dienelactone hydrolase family protein n=1 Tax=Talaromyces stipitatus (strain ATCC 10500 / CBS 375.48 / QM 6759 / NRRL 1006) TaxID=441959 RepID=B8LZY6_TALSN|nr:dienelactone hydrolase family protein [Talaromyces stipitatus ATCC 10500]EED20918.1 dienelactone hydrolase family protein [Talaromyces stipitatus ATCC 10500]
MASNPPGQCCVASFQHDGVPRGEIGKIDQTSTYFTYPDTHTDATKSSDTAIIFITDILGIYINSKLQADLFAQSLKCPVIMPDLFHGDAIPADAFEKGPVDLKPWLEKHSVETVDPVIERTIKYLREEKGVQRIGAVGYCFGGKYVVRFLADRSPAVDTGYIAHPSFIADDELAAIQKPLAITASETDSIFTRELRFKSEDILSRTGQPYQITLFSGVSHGFAVKRELANRHQNWCKEQAFEQAVSWFREGKQARNGPELRASACYNFRGLSKPLPAWLLHLNSMFPLRSSLSLFKVRRCDTKDQPDQEYKWNDLNDLRPNRHSQNRRLLNIHHGFKLDQNAKICENLFEPWKNKIFDWEVLREIGATRDKHRGGVPDELFAPKRGTFNTWIRMKFKDGGSAVMRFPCPGASVFPEEKVKREIAVMRFLEHFTNIRVPHILHSGMAAGSPCGLGPFIIMEYIDHDYDFIDALNIPGRWRQERPLMNPDISSERLNLVYRQMADILLQLSDHYPCLKKRSPYGRLTEFHRPFSVEQRCCFESGFGRILPCLMITAQTPHFQPGWLDASKWTMSPCLSIVSRRDLRVRSVAGCTCVSKKAWCVSTASRGLSWCWQQMGLHSRDDFLYARGLVNYNLTAQHNAIPLCGVCRANYDSDSDPGLAIMPTDLQFFIDFEKRDRRDRRRAATRSGLMPQRTVQNGEQYTRAGGIYKPIEIKKYLHPGIPTIAEFIAPYLQPKEWNGAPLAMLRRCFSLLGNPRCGFLEQRNKLQELYSLYFGAVVQDDTEDSNDPSDHDEAISGTTRHEKRKRSHGEGSHDDYRPSGKKARSETTGTRKSQDAEREAKHYTSWCWEFGPEYSTAEVVERFAPLVFPQKKTNCAS